MLRFARYRVHLQAEELLRLPAWKGSTLRGAFGHVFRRLACTGGRLCPPCQVPDRCPYHYIFETAPPPGAQALRKLSDIPRPCVLEPP
ncbi:MAG: CRISPR system precrRNA processing endoribonuclease RAMP protein Cas6, partial [Armatimonadota bacterium]